jgi:phosphonatase-like hydrolase
MGLKLMVFDMAGTTVSDEGDAVARCVCEALRAAGVPADEADVNPVMGMPKPLAIRLLLERAGRAGVAEAAPQVHADFQKRMIHHYQTSDMVCPMPGAEEVFRELRGRGIAVALDTGFDRETLDVIVDRLGWEGAIDTSVASDEVPNGRPSPDLIHAAMRATNVTESRLVGKVGDSVSDIEEGLAAGCGLVAAVLCVRTREVVAQYPSVHAIETLSELLPLLDAHDREAG